MQNFSLFVSGIYVCSECGHELFSSKVKFKHSTPWPAFAETVRPDSVLKKEESPGALKVRVQYLDLGIDVFCRFVTTRNFTGDACLKSS